MEEKMLNEHNKQEYPPMHTAEHLVNGEIARRYGCRRAARTSIIELKYDGSAEEALKQIDDKKYDRKFQMDGREIIRIGVNFSSDTRCIEDWKIQKS